MSKNLGSIENGHFSNFFRENFNDWSLVVLIDVKGIDVAQPI